MKMTKFKMPKFDKKQQKADMHNEGVANAGEAKLNYALRCRNYGWAPFTGLASVPRNGRTMDQARQGGTAGTYKAVCAALAAGPMDQGPLGLSARLTAMLAFARYAVRNHWLLPVTAVT